MAKGWALRQLEPVLFLWRQVEVETDAGRRGYHGGPVVLGETGPASRVFVVWTASSNPARRSRRVGAGGVVGHSRRRRHWHRQVAQWSLTPSRSWKSISNSDSLTPNPQNFELSQSRLARPRRRCSGTIETVCPVANHDSRDPLSPGAGGGPGGHSTGHLFVAWRNAKHNSATPSSQTLS